ncbi:amidase family protein, partial [Stenotrophomonas maltophilia]|uniref:amidase family protein n=1 Tax=Stenotrophomonas maltophilia TaxID=40324 RepID=UPI001EF80383
VETARLIAAGVLDPVAVLDAHLARIHALDGGLGAFVHLDEAEAGQAAIAARLAVRCGGPLGPLHGVPIGIKDIIDVGGQPTSIMSL